MCSAGMTLVSLVAIRVHQPLFGRQHVYAKNRNGRVQLYRSTYVRKGANGNTHGYAKQEFVGSLPAQSLGHPVRASVPAYR